MGDWDIYCCICGGPIINKFLKGREVYNPINGDMYMVDKTISEYNWLFNLVLITSTEKTILTNGKYYDGKGIIKFKGKTFVITPNKWHQPKLEADGYGTVCHRDCYKLLQNRLRHKLQFANICRMLDDLSGVIKTVSKYRIMQRYSFGQYFEHHLARDENGWLLNSPLINKKNSGRILKMWDPLVEKFKRDPPRRAPCESAAKFKAGKKLPGYDGKDWIVIQRKGVKRWVRDIEGEPVRKPTFRKPKRKFIKKSPKKRYLRASSPRKRSRRKSSSRKRSRRRY